MSFLSMIGFSMDTVPNLVWDFRLRRQVSFYAI